MTWASSSGMPATRPRSRWSSWSSWRPSPWASSSSSTAGCITNENPRARAPRRLAPGLSLGPPARLLSVDGLPPGGVLHAFRADGVAHDGKLREGLGRGAVHALLPQHHPARDHDPGGPARPLHAGGLRFRALQL